MPLCWHEVHFPLVMYNYSLFYMPNKKFGETKFKKKKTFPGIPIIPSPVVSNKKLSSRCSCQLMQWKAKAFFLTFFLGEEVNEAGGNCSTGS